MGNREREQRGGRQIDQSWREESIAGSATPGGMMQRDMHGRLPSPIVHVKSHNPIAGNVLVIASPPTAAPGGGLVPQALTQLAYLTTPDNVPRKVTVIVTQNSPVTNTESGAAIANAGLYVKLTVGTDRGSVTQWVSAPCVIPTEGTFVKVEATIGVTPFRVVASDALAINSGLGMPPAPQGAGNQQCYASALVVDGSNDEGPSILLGLSGPFQCGGAPFAGFLVQGPVLIDEIILHNTNASASVLMAALDAKAIAPSDIAALVYVPPQGSVSIGRDLLGAFANGLNLTGITPPPTGSITVDTNDLNVYAQVRGRYILPGGF